MRANSMDTRDLTSMGYLGSALLRLKVSRQNGSALTWARGSSRQFHWDSSIASEF